MPVTVEVQLRSADHDHLGKLVANAKRKKKPTGWRPERQQPPALKRT